VKHLIILVTLLYSFEAFSSNPYELFPIGNIMYYFYTQANAEEGHSFIEKTKVKSVRVNGIGDTTLLFHGFSEFFNSLLPACGGQFELEKELELWDDMNTPYYNSGRGRVMHLDSLHFRNDSVIYSSSLFNSVFYLLNNVTEGTSWEVFNGANNPDYEKVQITFSETTLDTFLGLTDSVRLYTMKGLGSSAQNFSIDSFVIKLSKHYGLIEFVPFNTIINHGVNREIIKMSLAGFETDSINVGYKAPALDDFFIIQPGDILFWKETDRYFVNSLVIKVKYHRDSILTIQKSPNTYSYTYDRTTYTENNPDTIIFNKSSQIDVDLFENKILSSYTNSVVKPNSSQSTLYFVGNYRLIKRDSNFTTTSIPYVLNGYTHSGCQFSRFYDNDRSFVYSQPAIIANDSDCDMTCNIKSIVAFRIDTSSYGNWDMDFSQNTSINSLNKTTIKYYPNPVESSLKLECEECIGMNYSVLDLFGKEMQSGILHSEVIDLSPIHNGNYFIRLTNSKFNLVLRINKL